MILPLMRGDRGLAVSAVSLLLAAGVATFSPSAVAAPTAQDKALAETLFRDAKALMAARNYAAACPKLAASQQYDPQLGTLLNLALCHEADGKTASAWTEFDEAANEATRLGQADRASFARSHAAPLEAKLSRLRVVVSAPPAGLTVKVDGTELSQSAWGEAIPLDPGEHAVEASAMGKVTNTQKALLPNAAGIVAVTVGALADAAAPASGTSGTSPPAGQATAASDSDGSSMRTVGYALAGLGVVGLGLGTVFGIETFSKKSAVSTHCQAFCDDTGLSAQSASHTDATVSTVAFGVGIAAAAVGVYFVLAAPHGSDAPRATASSNAAAASWWVSPRLGGLATGGTF